ncbi:helix-hairpin-helix domain-containing protein [Massilia glaciei]|uniref:Mitomycin resistance protein n=1 Tax=Massilia glaciei TaxID=1524097 RepID=A0A2U2HLH9_9BURK|nr:helix-hairpin-helix domain-containing protein [Massilia glaciei]PWF48378.1 mitomycin resistance protein [Massilia glaciei]
MNPSKVDRNKLERLEQLPNIGKACAADLRQLGIETPQGLIGRNACDLYEELCIVTGVRHDPCMLDTFMSIVSFMEGGPALPWWSFTEQRKRMLKAAAA